MVQDGNWLGREENRRTALFMETKEKKRFIWKQLSQQWRTRKEDQKKWISWIEVTDNVKSSSFSRQVKVGRGIQGE